MNFMKKALFLANQAAEEDEVPVGALIIQDGIVIGQGYNKRESHQNPIAHAEILAIQNAAETLQSWRLNGCTLIVTLEPCPMCLAACQQARIAEVVYGAKDPKGGALSLGYLLHEDKRTNHRFKVRYEEAPECGKILTEFFANKR